MADALSRRPDHNLNNISNVINDDTLMNDIKAAYANDRVCRKIIQQHSDNKLDDESLSVSDELIYKDNRVYVPSNEWYYVEVIM